jgi:hypothetical protein
VLPAFDPQNAAISAQAGAAPEQTTATGLFTAGNNSTNQAGGVVAAGNLLLMPASTQAINAAGSTRAGMEGETLTLIATNSSNRLQRETENLPSWDLSVDMTHRRGLGMWVTGDNSGALLLIEPGHRDYVVPIDFNGRRYLEIPNGEVSWARSDWGWRMETKSTDYSAVRSVKIGIGQLPSGGKATVKVEQLTALGEIPVALKNPVIHIGSGQLRVQGAIGSGQFLQYTGGDKAILYDENWRQRGELLVEKDSYIMPTGPTSVTVTSEPAVPEPWLDVQFITTGTPMTLTIK